MIAPLYPFAGCAVAIVGSRTYPRPDLVRAYVNTLCSDPSLLLWPRLIISGGARGVDTWAVEAAQMAGVETKVIHAEWDRLGRRAGVERNIGIVAGADAVVAFWDLQSPGTQHTISLARSMGRSLLVFGLDGRLRRMAQ